jgi:hypothetical protein
MSIGIENIKEIDPNWVQGISVEDVLIFLSFWLFFFGIPYLYIRFIEMRLSSFVGNWLVPFFKSKLHLEKPMILIKKILQIEPFRNL